MRKLSGDSKNLKKKRRKKFSNIFKSKWDKYIKSMSVSLFLIASKIMYKLAESIKI